MKGGSAGYCVTPCISPEGRVYCPLGLGPEVLVFEFDGSPLPGLTVDSLGLSASTRWASYADGEAPSLLLLNMNYASSRLVSVDPATRTVRWTSSAGGFNERAGIATLASLGVVIINTSDHLFAHRLSDGSRVGSLSVPGLGRFLAADPATGSVFGSFADNGYVVHAWSCAAYEAGVRIASDGPVAAAGTIHDTRPLAVVPPAPGKRVSHLVVGVAFSSTLLVLSLPGLSLVHTHSLEGMQVMGLAADPWGGALAVCDAASETLHVLAWPLPGMPQMQ